MSTDNPSTYKTVDQLESKLERKKPIFLCPEYEEVLIEESQLDKALDRFLEFSDFIEKIFIPELEKEIGTLDKYFFDIFGLEKAPEAFVKGLESIGYDTFCLLYIINTPEVADQKIAVMSRIKNQFEQPIGKSTFKSMCNLLLHDVETSKKEKNILKIPRIENMAIWSFVLFLQYLKKDLDQFEGYEAQREEVGGEGGIEAMFLNRIYTNNLTHKDLLPFTKKLDTNIQHKIAQMFQQHPDADFEPGFSKFSALIEAVILQNLKQ